jgi:transposase
MPSPSKFRTYPDQVWLLPPSVAEVPGEQHLSLLVHRIVEQLDTSAMESEYSTEGKPGVSLRMMLKLWQ